MSICDLIFAKMAKKMLKLDLARPNGRKPSDTGHIEAAGRPTKCVSLKNEDFHCEIEKNVIFLLKIKKKAMKSHICKAKSFQK